MVVGGETVTEDRVVVIAVEGGTITEDGVEVNTSRVVFFFGFVVFEVVDFALLLLLAVPKKYETHLLIVSFFSWSKIRKSHSKA